MQFVFNDTATTEIDTLSLHDALPVCSALEVALELASTIAANGPLAVAVTKQIARSAPGWPAEESWDRQDELMQPVLDRKSTRLNSSHANISYAVFCLKNKTYAVE